MMSEGKTPPRDSKLDDVLGAWPARERTALEWDDSAERVLSLIDSEEPTRLGETLGHVSDEDLLRAPLPTAPGEVQSSAPAETRTEGTSMTSESRERDRAGFRDLAKLANMAPPPSSVSSVRSAERSAPGEDSGKSSQKDWEANSGVIDLGTLASNDAAPAESKPKASGAVSASAVAQATMRSAGNEAKPAAVAQDAKPADSKEKPAATKRAGGPWMAISGVVAAAAVGAGVFFGLQHGDRAASPASVAVAPPPATAAAPAAEKPVTATVASAAATPLPPDDRGVDPSSLPPASTATGSALAMRGTTPSVATPKPAAAPGAPTTDPALVATIPTATAAPSSSANLQALMQQAAGVTSTPTATAAAAAADESSPAPGSVPLKPSQGAIQGALGAALPSARGCLGPDDPISHATITFKSDGSVQSVGVTGGAAGKPAEACIRGALSKARITPFAQPTFTATATVRPN
ncbi:MAG: hypothetical protein ABSE49_04505 [Polyangiaceae bacterium]